MSKPEYLEATSQQCTCCGKTKHPTKGYLRLLKSQRLPYVCSSCRESKPLPAMFAGKLGVIS